jgi:hypothetical protein
MSVASLGPAWAANQNLRRDSEFFVQLANRVEREGSLALHDFIDARSAADHSDQSQRIFALLLKAEFNSRDGVREIDGIVLAFVDFHPRGENVELVALSRALARREREKVASG